MRKNTSLKSRLWWVAGFSVLTACGAESLSNSGGYPADMVGARRVALTDGAQQFSDYVFSADGTLTHLRSVVAGKVVDAASGAGVVRAVDGASCRFGQHWYGIDGNILVIEGLCSDGGDREIALTLSSAGYGEQNASPSATWMMPSSWRIQRCDQKACAD
jgi:hypothetical protein